MGGVQVDLRLRRLAEAPVAPPDLHVPVDEALLCCAAHGVAPVPGAFAPAWQDPRREPEGEDHLRPGRTLRRGSDIRLAPPGGTNRRGFDGRLSQEAFYQPGWTRVVKDLREVLAADEVDVVDAEVGRYDLVAGRPAPAGPLDNPWAPPVEGVRSGQACHRRGGPASCVAAPGRTR